MFDPRNVGKRIKCLNFILNYPRMYVKLLITLYPLFLEGHFLTFLQCLNTQSSALRNDNKHLIAIKVYVILDI